MPYGLGVDIGTTFTAAAVCRDGSCEILGLGERALQVPSVVYLREDGTFLVGEAAEARATADPQRVAREFKRRLGDSIPVLVGGVPFSAEALSAQVLRWVVGVASQREGEPPQSVTVTHPANWGAFRLDLFRQVFLLAELNDVRTCTEPQAAAMNYAARNRVPDGARVAVYDLGGGTFDAALVRNAGGEFLLEGTAEGIDHLGGVDFDEAVFGHVLRAAGVDLTRFDQDDQELLWALHRLRRDCVAAKETLSVDTEALVAVHLGQTHATVRITRGEFEDLIRPALEQTIAVMSRVFQSAGITAADVSAFVLVGGSSRIPLVSELLAGAFGRPLSLDAHPKHEVALGAARIGAPGGAPAAVAGPAPPGPGAPPPPPPAPPGWPAPPGPPVRGSKRGVLLAAAVVAALAAGVVAFLLLGNSSSGGDHPRRTSVIARSSPGAPTSTHSTSTAPVRPMAGKPLGLEQMLVPRLTKPDGHEIFVMDADGTLGPQVTHGRYDDDVPVLSHDRRTMAYLQYLPDGTQVVHLAGVDGSGDRPLFSKVDPNCVVYGRPAFRKGDQELAIKCGPSGQAAFAIYLVDLAKPALPSTPLVPPSANVGTVGFSPDGQFLVYWIGPDPATTHIMTIRLSDKSRQQLTFGKVNDRDEQWSPDGRFIAFRRVVGSSDDIWILNVRTKKTIKVTSDSKKDREPNWSPDSKRLAFVRGSGKTARVWIVELNADGSASEAKPLWADDPAGEWLPAWSAR